jgi:hypothetical protein
MHHREQHPQPATKKTNYARCRPRRSLPEAPPENHDHEPRHHLTESSKSCSPRPTPTPWPLAARLSHAISNAMTHAVISEGLTSRDISTAEEAPSSKQQQRRFSPATASIGKLQREPRYRSIMQIQLAPTLLQHTSARDALLSRFHKRHVRAVIGEELSSRTDHTGEALARGISSFLFPGADA